MATSSPPERRTLSLQTAATVVTAVFAVYVFFVKERPLLEERASGLVHLSWTDLRKTGACRATVDVMLKNDGVKAFAVEKVRVRAWQLDEPKGPTEKAVYVDMDASLRTQSPINDQSYDINQASKQPSSLTPPLIARYASGMSYNGSFEWLIPRDQSKRFYVRLDLYRSVKDDVAEWYFSHSSPVCVNAKER